MPIEHLGCKAINRQACNVALLVDPEVRGRIGHNLDVAANYLLQHRQHAALLDVDQPHGSVYLDNYRVRWNHLRLHAFPPQPLLGAGGG